MMDRRARFAASAPLLVAGAMLSGCMGAPTYGTGTPADQQLLTDVSDMFSLAPKDDKKIDYKPRPDLVRPAPGEKETLPVPQDNIVTASGSAWPESPEQRRDRLRAEATANQDNGSFQSPIVNDVSKGAGGVRQAAQFGQPGNFETEQTGSSRPRIFRSNPGITSEARIGMRGNFETANVADQREEFNRRLAENKQGSATNRKYLSEPPLVYREPAATAPVGDVGEDEWKKERRQKKAAAKDKSWRDYLPF